MNLSDLANVPSFPVYRSFARGNGTGSELDDFLEKFRYRDPLFEGMAKGSLSVDRVSISSSVLLTGDDGGLLELGNDALNGPLGDADLGGDISEPRFRIAEQTHQNMSVVCQKRPAVRRF